MKTSTNEKQVSVAVVGGAGFIGTSLCRRMQNEGIKFVIIDLKKSDIFPEQSIVVDLLDTEELKRFIKCEIIVNLAAAHRDDLDASDYYRINVDGARSICEAAKSINTKRIIFTSSVAVYGFAPAGTTEDGLLQPFNHYGKSKVAAERIFTQWQNSDQNQRELFIVRPTAVFGEGNRGNIFNLLQQVHKKRFLMIGAGRNQKSIAYVENLSEFLLKCILSDKKFGLFNYVDTPNLEMRALVETIGRLFGQTGAFIRIPKLLAHCAAVAFDLISFLTGKSFPISSIRVKKFTENTCFTANLSSISGFQRPFTIEEGLERTINYEFQSK
jgi:nucleoside-diphosphate-sugar epimerase